MEIFESIRRRLEKISSLMNLSPEEVNLLLRHKSVKKAVLEIDNRFYDSWRIIHNDSLGPGKGGIRFHENVSEDEVKSLSFWMSLKNSLMNLPLGGAKGGVRVNPKELTKKDIEKISREYIRAFHEFLGQDKDIPAPDVYTNKKVMAIMLDEYEKIKQRHEPGMITGKPVELGGLSLRADATSKGGLIILKSFLERENTNGEIKIAIQGFGNAGMNIAPMLDDEGFNIIAVSDSKGGVVNKSGLDILEIEKLKKQGRSVLDYEHGEKITNKELLELDVDVLILAALENQISIDNAEKINAKYILELANGPITSEADNILFRKNIIVIPDILANAGGVVVSYFEWLQNKIGNILEEEFLKTKLEEMMIDAFEKVYKLFKENKTEFDMRTAAYILAIKRILNAEKLRGNV